jgi:hypothetical protein
VALCGYTNSSRTQSEGGLVPSGWQFGNYRNTGSKPQRNVTVLPEAKTRVNSFVNLSRTL